MFFNSYAIPTAPRGLSQMLMFPFSARRLFSEMSLIGCPIGPNTVSLCFSFFVTHVLRYKVPLTFSSLVLLWRQVALIYFQLVREDHQWWWRSFLSGGSTGLFVYAYSFFFFFQRSQMHGLLQVFASSTQRLLGIAVCLFFSLFFQPLFCRLCGRLA